MPFAYKINSDNSIVEVDLLGPSDIQDIFNSIEAFTSDTLYRHHFGICWDAQKSNYLPGYSEVSMIYKEFTKRFHDIIKGRFAIVVGNQIQYGIGRMASTIFSSIDIHIEVFFTKEQALLWLKENQLKE